MRLKLEIGAIVIAMLVVVGVGMFGDRDQGSVALPSGPSSTEQTARLEPTAPPGPVDVLALEHFGGRLDNAASRPEENTTTRLWVFDSVGPRHQATELLPDRTGAQGDPAWSASGALAFTESGRLDQVYLTTRSGDTPTLLEIPCATTCGHSQASFSPDGTHVVVRRVVFGAGPAEPPTQDVLAMVDIGTGEATELASTTLDVGPIANLYPRWSPDGERIAFYRATYNSDGSLGASSLFLVNVDGTGLKELTTVPFAGDPAWSPDGSSIAFSTYPRRVDAAVGERVTGLDLYTIRADGTDLERLTSDGVSSAPAWTSDGRIVYISSPMVGDFLATDVGVMRADGTDRSMLTGFAYGRGQCCTFYVQAQPSLASP
jgi:hypothetical protein